MNDDIVQRRSAVVTASNTTAERRDTLVEAITSRIISTHPRTFSDSGVQYSIGLFEPPTHFQRIRIRTLT